MTTVTLTLHCGQCSKQLTEEFYDDNKFLKKKIRQQIQAIADRSGWIVQDNGKNVDCYCSKRCAL